MLVYSSDSPLSRPSAAPSLPVGQRTHYHVTVNYFAIRRNLPPILIERPDGLVLTVFNVDFGDATVFMRTQLDPAQQLPRRPTWAETGFTNSTVWMVVEPGMQEMQVSLHYHEDDGPTALRPLSEIPERDWATYAFIWRSMPG